MHQELQSIQKGVLVNISRTNSIHRAIHLSVRVVHQLRSPSCCHHRSHLHNTQISSTHSDQLNTHPHTLRSAPHQLHTHPHWNSPSFSLLSSLPSSAYLGVALVCTYAKVSCAPLKPAYNSQLQCATSCSVQHLDLRARLWGSMVGHKSPFRLVVTVIPAVLLPPEWCLVAHLSNVLNTQN